MKNAQHFYTSATKCAIHILTEEGVMAFYKGFLSNYLRLAPWNIIMFMTYEQYK